jgi:hypothetical protein
MGFLLTKPAFAATNGQQLKVCQSEDYTQMHLQGTNQDGVTTSATFGITPADCGVSEGYWWVGDVTIELADSKTDAPNRSVSCDVPQEQVGDDVFTCRVNPLPS